MRKSKIILILLLSITMTSSIATTGFASEITPKNNTIKETKLINEKDVLEKLDNFVCYDNATKSFSIKDGAKESLTDKEYETLSNCIKTTNYNISIADFSTGEVNVVSPTGEKSQSISDRSYNEGVTKIDFYWWGAAIYLSKSTIQYASGGIAIAGIWIPEPVVSKIVASVGVIGSLCPGGIYFEYNYIKAGITFLASGMNIGFSGVQNIRFQ